MGRLSHILTKHRQINYFESHPTFDSHAKKEQMLIADLWPPIANRFT